MLGINPRRSTRRPIIILLVLVFGVLLFANPYGNMPDEVEVEGESTKTKAEGQKYVTVTVNECEGKSGLREFADAVGDETLEEHEYRDDGLLQVNPMGPHPIYELVRRAQDEWDAKLRKASTTLEDAVVEYQRRYKRLPPRGFDDWWAYVEENNVKLPDEYDQIFRDLEPFWGMNPEDLQQIQRDWEAHEDSFTIGKDTYEDVLSLKNYSIPGDDGGRNGLAKNAYELVDLLEEVEDLIPPFRAIFSPHDNPNLPYDYELKESALKAARSGSYVSLSNPPEVKLDGWLASCSPYSPARSGPINWGGAPMPSPFKSFIYDHRTSMDPCQHPSHLLNHGQFIAFRKGPIPHRTLIPQFSFGPTMLHQDITPAMPINWIDDIMPREDDPEWDERWDERLQWRGSNTGIWHADDNRWDLAQRARLVRWAGDGDKNGPDAVDRNLTVLRSVEEGKSVGEPMKVRKAQWAPAMVDVAFAGDQINCAPEMCKKLKEVFEYRKRQNVATAGKYKYYIDVDGNGWSSRFKRLITTNGLVFKSTIYPEWYTDRVAPWVHYVPIQIDLSDLWDALSFFRGDPGGRGEHNKMARKIAKDGREWSRTFWRQQDMVAYNFRLFLEYSRVMDPERQSLAFDLALLRKDKQVMFQGRREKRIVVAQSDKLPVSNSDTSTIDD